MLLMIVILLVILIAAVLSPCAVKVILLVCIATICAFISFGAFLVAMH